ncbi:MAG: hypothetical protein OEY59_09070 [Deltaproteobacteria bacterium]|nr:hypothetical protein [Deltaproteobacteria bacterium]
MNNKSFTPRLSLIFKEILSNKLAYEGIHETESDDADLSVELTIKEAKLLRTESAILGNQNQVVNNYEFLFVVSGEFSLYDQRDQSTIFKRIPLSGSYRLETFSENINLMEVDEGNYRAVENITKKIVSYLTQNF